MIFCSYLESGVKRNFTEEKVFYEVLKLLHYRIKIIILENVTISYDKIKYNSFEIIAILLLVGFHKDFPPIYR